MIYATDSDVWRRKVCTRTLKNRDELLDRFKCYLNSPCEYHLHGVFKTFAWDWELLQIEEYCNMRRRSSREQQEKLMKVVFQRVLQRADLAWEQSYHGPARIVAKWVVRNRWENSSDMISHQYYGHLAAFRARIFLGLLNVQMRTFIRRLNCGFGELLNRRGYKLVKRLLLKLGNVGKCRKGFVLAYRMLLENCYTGEELTVNISSAVNWRLRQGFMEAQRHDEMGALDAKHAESEAFEFQQNLRFWESLPDCIKNAPIDKAICWHCGTGARMKLQSCQTCQVARYCDRACFAEAWSSHKSVCARLKGLLNKHQAKKVVAECHSSSDTWGDVVFRKLFSDQGRMRFHFHWDDSGVAVQCYERSQKEPSMKAEGVGRGVRSWEGVKGEARGGVVTVYVCECVCVCV